ncbi:hypothetical protein AB0N06_33485 [Streptomyces sp. NPDC051020]|uniref:hypothetical protein n=1 Tax=Streptomyces sp. NPDC051020 TaxID=3155409 RepID=UPI00344AEF44
MTRPEELIKRYPTLFDSEREAKLPVWAQAKLGDLRLVLLGEAEESDHLRADIDRMSGTIDRLNTELDRHASGHHN